MNTTNYLRIFLGTLLCVPLSADALEKAHHFHAPHLAMQQQPAPHFGSPTLAQAPGLPGPGAMPELPPGVTPEQFESALKEIDTFFNNMSEEEMKEFLNFVQDVESGKIDINELLPPGMMPPPGAKPALAPAAPEAKPAPMPEIRPQAPKGPALRNKQAAQRMLKDIIEHLSAIRVKAASYDRVAQALEPWNKRLDTLTYYVHVITDKEHVEHLVSNKDLLPLHDALKELSESLNKQEPLIEVPEFGLEKIEKATKERSQKALRAVLVSFDTFFTRHSGISKLEQLMKLYEPELLKKRKEAEQAEERALRDAQARATMQPAPSRVRYEGGYGYAPPSRNGRAGNGRFYDRYYTPEANLYSRPSTHDRPSITKGMQAPQRGGEKAASKEAAAKKEDAEQVTAPGQVAPPSKRPAISKAGFEDAEATRLFNRLENSFAFVNEALSQDIFQKELKTYFELDAPAGGEAVPPALEKARLLNDELENMAQALHRIAKDHGALENRIKKLRPNMRAAYEKQLSTLFNAYQPRLNAVYDAGMNFEQKAYNEQQAPQLRNKIALHLGMEQKNVALPYLAEKNFSLGEFMDAYELVFDPREREERQQRKEAYEQKIAAAKAAAEAKEKKKAQRRGGASEAEDAVDEEPESPELGISESEDSASDSEGAVTKFQSPDNP